MSTLSKWQNTVDSYSNTQSQTHATNLGSVHITILWKYDFFKNSMSKSLSTLNALILNVYICNYVSIL